MQRRNALVALLASLGALLPWRAKAAEKAGPSFVPVRPKWTYEHHLTDEVQMHATLVFNVPMELSFEDKVQLAERMVMIEYDFRRKLEGLPIDVRSLSRPSTLTPEEVAEREAIRRQVRVPLG